MATKTKGELITEIVLLNQEKDALIEEAEANKKDWANLHTSQHEDSLKLIHEKVHLNGELAHFKKANENYAGGVAAQAQEISELIEERDQLARLGLASVKVIKESNNEVKDKSIAVLEYQAEVHALKSLGIAGMQREKALKEALDAKDKELYSVSTAYDLKIARVKELEEEKDNLIKEKDNRTEALELFQISTQKLKDRIVVLKDGAKANTTGVRYLQGELQNKVEKIEAQRIYINERAEERVELDRKVASLEKMIDSLTLDYNCMNSANDLNRAKVRELEEEVTVAESRMDKQTLDLAYKVEKIKRLGIDLKLKSVEIHNGVIKDNARVEEIKSLQGIVSTLEDDKTHSVIGLVEEIKNNLKQIRGLFDSLEDKLNAATKFNKILEKQLSDSGEIHDNTIKRLETLERVAGSEQSFSFTLRNRIESVEESMTKLIKETGRAIVNDKDAVAIITEHSGRVIALENKVDSLEDDISRNTKRGGE